MVNLIYPNEKDLRLFIKVIKEENFIIKKYLPHIDDEWFMVVLDCINYVRDTSKYENLDIYQGASKILYKVAKRHELGDGNKRSGVMSVYIFCLVNDFYINNPQELKNLARRIAKTRGRINEDLLRKRIAKCLKNIMVCFLEEDKTEIKK
jgi:death-on-curing family protein